MERHKQKAYKSSTTPVGKAKSAVKTDKVSSHKKEKVIPQAIAVATAVPTPNKKGTGRKGKISNAEKTIRDIIGVIQVQGEDNIPSALKSIKKQSDEEIYKFLGECAKYKTILSKQTLTGGASLATIYGRADGDTKVVYDGLAKLDASHLEKTIRKTNKQIAELQETISKLEDKVMLCQYYHSKTDGDLVILKHIVSHLQDFTSSRNQESQEPFDAYGDDDEEQDYDDDDEEEETKEQDEDDEDDDEGDDESD